MDSSWFEAMVADVRERPDVYRRLGFADLRLAVEETDAGVARSFGLVLDGYDVRSVGALEDVEAFHPEVTLAGPREAWDEMFDNIVRHGCADGAHTLNTPSIADSPLKVTSEDPVGRDKFFRYAETLQTLFDALGGARASV